jgi:tetratricopeptide (TPR) repeat protein
MCSIKARFLAGFLFLFSLLGGCAAILPQASALRDRPPPDLPPQAELTAVPFYPQEDYQCGPAALAMVLNAGGLNVTPESLIDQVYIPARQGSLQIEMLVAARRHGMIAYELAPELTDVLREIAAGTPVISLENYGLKVFPKWHYAVLVGYDLAENELIRRSGTRQRQTMPFGVFEYNWKTDGRWAMVAVPPDRVPVTATEPRFANAVVALERTGKLQSAHTAYKAMLERWPGSLAGEMGRGNTAYALRDFATAEAAFRRASSQHPDSPAPLNNLAQLLAERGALAEALQAAERAVSLGGPLLSTTQATLDEIRRKTQTRIE